MPWSKRCKREDEDAVAPHKVVLVVLAHVARALRHGGALRQRVRRPTFVEGVAEAAEPPHLHEAEVHNVMGVPYGHGRAGHEGGGEPAMQTQLVFFCSGLQLQKGLARAHVEVWMRGHVPQAVPVGRRGLGEEDGHIDACDAAVGVRVDDAPASSSRHGCGAVPAGSRHGKGPCAASGALHCERPDNDAAETTNTTAELLHDVLLGVARGRSRPVPLTRPGGRVGPAHRHDVSSARRPRHMTAGRIILRVATADLPEHPLRDHIVVNGMLVWASPARAYGDDAAGAAAAAGAARRARGFDRSIDDALRAWDEVCAAFPDATDAPREVVERTLRYVGQYARAAVLVCIREYRVRLFRPVVHPAFRNDWGAQLVGRAAGDPSQYWTNADVLCTQAVGPDGWGDGMLECYRHMLEQAARRVRRLARRRHSTSSAPPFHGR